MNKKPEIIFNRLNYLLQNPLVISQTKQTLRHWEEGLKVLTPLPLDADDAPFRFPLYCTQDQDQG